MNIELKNIKYSAFASQETNCFSASIYIDGHKRGTVENSGHGGCDNITPWQLGKEIEEYAKTLPSEEFEGHTLPESADTLIGGLLNKWLEDRDLKRLCKKNVLFRKPTETYKAGEYCTLKGTYSIDAARFLRGKYGEKVEIVNERFL
mgnify:CR=1 FL=1